MADDKPKVIDRRNRKFVWVDRAVMEHHEGFARSTDKLVYVMLCMYADNEKQTSWPSIERLAQLCGCGERTVRYSIAKLTELKLISVESRYDSRGYRTSNVYYILDPPNGI